MSEREFSVGDDGLADVKDIAPNVDLPSEVVPVAAPVQLGTGLTATNVDDSGYKHHESMLPTILEKIHDRNFPLDEVNRLIAIEIAFVAQEMQQLRQMVSRNDHTETFMQKSFEQQVKALQALEKSLTNTDILRNRDILNFDGPKFVYVFGELVNVFKKAAQDAVGRDNETIVQSIMKHFRDEMAMREDELRRETEKIDSSKKKG
ncbi:Uncharacterised protein [uncultured archaeon]|nr:Uncharacterised protein [uncultured archaeon]